MSTTTVPHRTALERQLIRLVADVLPVLELLAAGRVAGETRIQARREVERSTALLRTIGRLPFAERSSPPAAAPRCPIKPPRPEHLRGLDDAQLEHYRLLRRKGFPKAEALPMAQQPARQEARP
jgi:hypothetical protein